ncbi:hypothetical protein [Microbacterium sp. NPDC089695]|uniref:hypothetical protein n=1 Tax=Microbacterium sp. NPDC089695 TaxID=3364198 RepID=UPI0038084854
MTEPVEEPQRRPGWRVWAIAGAIVVLLVGGIVWGVLANSGSDQDPGAGSGTPGASPTPQPTEFETPTPGATDGADKPVDADEVAIDEPAPVVDGVVAEVTALEETTAGNDIPGEPSGPAIRVTVRLTNGSDEPIDTAGANTTLTYGGDDRLPAAGVAAEDATMWPATIPAGGHADAVFVFAVPSSPAGDIRVIVDVLATAPNVVFVGPRP